jgi:hypothetical protein
VRIRPGRDVAIVDVGAGGALIEAPTRLLPGTDVVLQFCSPTGGKAIRGRVLRCEVSSLDSARGILYRGALRFDEHCVWLDGDGETHEG